MFMLPAYDATAFAMLGFCRGFGPWILIGFCLPLLGAEPEPDGKERSLRNSSRTPRNALRLMAAIAAGSNEMDEFWEKMTLDEKCDQLRERIEMLVVEMANDQRKLHDRLVKLEQAHEARPQ